MKLRRKNQQNSNRRLSTRHIFYRIKKLKIWSLSKRSVVVVVMIGSGLLGITGYIKTQAVGSPAKEHISQVSYIWENDNEDFVSGDAYDENTQLAAGDTALTSVRQGERLTLRTQIENSGTVVDSNLSLFYDKNDGNWNKVRGTSAAQDTNGNCDTLGAGSNDWNCSTIEATGSTGLYPSISFDPAGNAWVAYNDNNKLGIANYVGSGGNCDTIGAGSDAWHCEVVDNGISSAWTGAQPSIAFDSVGRPWVAYRDIINTSLKLAKKIPGAGCATSEWTCEIVDNAADVGSNPSIAIDSSDVVWISYYDTTNANLKVAKNVAGTWISIGPIDSTGNVGDHSSIAIDPAGNPWISYMYINSFDVKVARFVSSGGNCSGSSLWDCSVVDVTGDSGYSTSIAFDPAGDPWVSYGDASAPYKLRAAKYVGSGGNCTNVAWECTLIDGVASNVGFYNSLAFDASGKPWIGYYNNTNSSVMITNYVGSGGNCSGSTAWQCTTVDATDDVGQYVSLAFDSNGSPWLAYYDNTNFNLEVATLNTSGGQIVLSPSQGANSGDVLSESHADMSTISDVANRDDADCSTGGAVWNNGVYAGAEEYPLSLPSGVGTTQCTEVAWVIDTSQAIVGETYRFIVATDDGIDQGKGRWRGLTSVSQYPTLTIESFFPNRIAKDNLTANGADCTNTDWTCSEFSTESGRNSSLVLDSRGTAWFSFYNRVSTRLEVAKYVGSGGNCSNTAWQCTVIDTYLLAGYNNSISIGLDDTPWISYSKGSSLTLVVAHYVGSGGNCTSAEWQCDTINTDNPSYIVSGVDINGSLWVAYNVVNNLKVAHYVGSGGSCTNTAWECTLITGDPPSSVGNFTLKFSSSGVPWISYDPSIDVVTMVTHYVGSGGNCLYTSLWQCDVVDSPMSGRFDYPSLEFSPSGVQWETYILNYGAGADLNVAHYVGSGGNCNNAEWQCSIINTIAFMSLTYSSIFFDSNGDMWIAYINSTTKELMLARYVGSGGSCTDTAWDCTTVASSVEAQPITMGASPSGELWISYTTLVPSTKIARLKLPPNYLSTNNLNSGYSKLKGGSGDARYRLNPGSSSRETVPNCNSASDGGYCGVQEVDGVFDTVQADINETALFTAALHTSNNSQIPLVKWVGKTTLAPNTASTDGDITLEIYNFTTDLWQQIDTNTTSSDCNTSACSLSGQTTGTPSDYFQTDGAAGWYMNVRVYQKGSTAAYTFKTDALMQAQTAGRLRGNKVFEESTLTPFRN